MKILAGCQLRKRKPIKEPIKINIDEGLLNRKHVINKGNMMQDISNPSNPSMKLVKFIMEHIRVTSTI